MLSKWPLLGLALLAAGCSAVLVENRDYVIDQPRRIIWARSALVAENICLMRGADFGTGWVRSIINGGVALGSGISSNVELGARPGCYDPNDDVLVLTADPRVPYAGLEAHELWHRSGGQHAP